MAYQSKPPRTGEWLTGILTELLEKRGLASFWGELPRYASTYLENGEIPPRPSAAATATVQRKWGNFWVFKLKSGARTMTAKLSSATFRGYGVCRWEIMALSRSDSRNPVDVGIRSGYYGYKRADQPIWKLRQVSQIESRGVADSLSSSGRPLRSPLSFQIERRAINFHIIDNPFFINYFHRLLRLNNAATRLNSVLKCTLRRLV
jgi:hypothetical protein